MALNIKNREVERLVEALSVATGESRTEAVRRALEERLARSRSSRFQTYRIEEVMDWLRSEVWPELPEAVRGRRVTRAEEEEMLGYGPEGT